MNASNLAVCFAPSLFHMCGVRPNAANPASVASPKRSRKQMNAAVPDQRELMEQKSAHQCLTAMIGHCKQLFTVSNVNAAYVLYIYLVAALQRASYVFSV